VVLEAALGTLNLVVAGCAGLVAAALHSLPVAALGAVAYFALVAWDSMNPEFQARVRKKYAPPGPNIEQLLQARDARVKRFASALLETRSARARAFEDAPQSARSFLEAALGQVPQLEAHAQVLLERLEALRSYLAEGSPAAIRTDLEGLEARRAQTGDAETREQLAAAIEAKQGQVRTLEELERTCERIDSNLTNVVTVLEGVPARLHQLRALDEQNRASYQQDVSGDLARLDAELAAFEETLKPTRLGARA